MGVKTPAGVDVDTLWSPDLRRPRDREADRAVRPVGAPGAVRGRGPRLRPRAVLRSQGGAPRRTASRSSASAPRPTRSSDAGELGADPSRCAVIAATGVGGLETMEENEATFLAARREPGEPVLRPDDDAERDRGHDLHPLRLDRTRRSASPPRAPPARTRSARACAWSATAAPRSSWPAAPRPGHPAHVSAFARMGALSTRNDDPRTASRPFDAARDGFVIAEGAAFCVLESLEHALARGATHLRRGARLRPQRRRAPHHRAGRPAARAPPRACSSRSTTPGSTPVGIGHVNAHGTSTPLNDATEAEAIRKVFGDDRRRRSRPPRASPGT